MSTFVKEKHIDEIVKEKRKDRILPMLIVASVLWPGWLVLDYYLYHDSFYFLLFFRIFLSLKCLLAAFLLSRKWISNTWAESLLLYPAFIFVAVLVNIAPEEGLTVAFIGSSMIPAATFLLLIIPPHRIITYVVFIISSVFMFTFLIDKHSALLITGQGGILYFSLTIFVAFFAYHNYYRFINEIRQRREIDTKNRILSEKQSELEQQKSLLEEQNIKLSEAIRERELLLKEVHHRVKNNLQIVSSLLRLQSETIKDKSPEQVLRESESRIAAMAIIHENLYKSDHLGRVDIQHYLSNLLDYVKATLHSGTMVKTVLQIEPAPFSIEKLVPCGLIVNELYTNAIKYAFPKQQDACIEIEGVYCDKHYCLTVKDNGVGLPPGFVLGESDSLGFSLVEGLVGQLGGTLKIESGAGTVVRFSFPI